MNSLEYQLLQKFPPKPREIWIVKPESAKMTAPPKEIKKGRFVLIVANPQLTEHNPVLIPAIPLTTKGQPGKTEFPLNKQAYEKYEGNFQPDSNSIALLQLYQPFILKSFTYKCGLINVDSYYAIQYLLCTEIIGYDPKYDISV